MSNITLKKRRPSAALRALKQPLYDTMEAPADANAVNQLVFFQQPLGSALNVSGNVKTVAETNMTQSGQLGSPNEFDLFGFCMTLMYADYYKTVGATYSTVANFVDDITEVYEQGVFQFRFGQNREYLTVPLTRIPHGPFHLTGPCDTASDNAAAAGVSYYFISNGDREKKEFFKYFVNDEPVFIGSNENFQVRLLWPNGAMGLTADGDTSRFTVYLVGVYYTAL